MINIIFIIAKGRSNRDGNAPQKGDSWYCC
jgi:hypothetical protein